MMAPPQLCRRAVSIHFPGNVTRALWWYACIIDLCIFLRTHTPPFLSAKQVRFVKILKRQNMTGKHSQVFFSITRKHSQVFFMGLLTPKTPFHPTFIEASYELLPSQENTRLNLFFQKKKKEKVKPKGFLWAPATPREHKTHPYSWPDGRAGAWPQLRDMLFGGVKMSKREIPPGAWPQLPEVSFGKPSQGGRGGPWEDTAVER